MKKCFETNTHISGFIADNINTYRPEFAKSGTTGIQHICKRLTAKAM